MRTFNEIARAAIDAGLLAAEAQGLRVSIVVIDNTFTPVCLSRMDGAFPSSVAVAIAKASTAVNFGKPSNVLANDIAAENKAALSLVDGRLMFVGGGVPIVAASGTVIAAAGVSGASEAADVAIAEATAAAAQRLLAP